jgi:predicted Kef-type K+ transport protein
MELLFYASAFVCGFIVLQFKLPPLIGFLCAGFILNMAGYQSTNLLETMAELGVTLLLFSIGLKLKIGSLIKVQVWGPATIHIVLCSLIFWAVLIALSYFNWSLFAQLSVSSAAILAFALSFSSTVFAVKVLEERGEMTSLHAKVAIGILVIQDIFAVVFLAVSTGKTPNLWAIALLAGLPLIRPAFYWMLSRSKHGEVLPLFGFFFALIIGYHAFEFAGLKGDLGALIIGMLLAPHKKAGELSKALLSFKDLFLIGFFLTIGLNADLTFSALLVAIVLVFVLPIKILLYYGLTNLFHLRARTSILGAFSLSNYSEFGLIVCALAVSSGWLTGEWLAVVAIAVALTFIIASPLNSRANDIYASLEKFLVRFESKKRLAEEMPVNLNNIKIIIFGMGRVGTGAYETIAQSYPDMVAGADVNPDIVDNHISRGRFAILADATDPDFWERMDHFDVEMVMLAMPKHAQNVMALQQIKAAGFKGQVTAIANYPDQQQELERMGVHSTYNFYLEAGSGFAEHVKDKVF